MKMKTKIYLGLPLLFLGILITSCEKNLQKPSNQNLQNQNVSNNLKNESFDEYIYWKNGEIINENQIDVENDSTTLIYDQTSNYVFVFTSDEAVLQWAYNQNSEFSLNVANSLKKLILLQKYIRKNNIEEYYDENGTTPKEYDIFFNNLFGSGEKSIVNFLHDSPDAAVAGSIWAPISYPKLSFVNFDNKTSAVSIAISAMWLCKNNWYKGSKSFFGALANTYQNIVFNNVASSVIVI
jgi:hypothetical protein